MRAIASSRLSEENIVAITPSLYGCAADCASAGSAAMLASICRRVIVILGVRVP